MAKKATTKTPAKGQKAEIEAILDEMKEAVLEGLRPKTFKNAGVETALRATMRPKIRRRLNAKGNWEKEKEKPLLVSKHMGQIAKILAKGNTVDLSVADAARVAVKSDENCPRIGSTGGGDWCF